jgi:hypothetical protein
LNKTNEYATINFKLRGWNEDSFFRVKAKFFKAPAKEPLYILYGKWNDSLTLKNMKTGKEEVIWKKNPYPENWEMQYGMTQFAI